MRLFCVTTVKACVAWCWLLFINSKCGSAVLEISHHYAPLCDHGSLNTCFNHRKVHVDQTPATANDHHLWKCGIWVENAYVVIKNAMNRFGEGCDVCCPYFHTLS